MPKPRLTALFVARIRTSGKYYDTFGMYLRVQSTGRRYWEQRFTIRGRSRTVGIGPYPIVTLKQARDAALENLRIVRSGVDPVVLRRRIKGVPTLADAALTVLALHRKKWTGPRQEGIWIRSLEKHVFPSLGLLPVSDITSADLLSILTPIWNSRPDMARAVRRRVSLVMKWAIANGYRTDNPAGDALTAALPSNHSSRTHFRALHYRDVSAALNLVGASTAYPSTKLLFEFLVLTAARSGEVRGARWDESILMRRCGLFRQIARSCGVRIEYRYLPERFPCCVKLTNASGRTIWFSPPRPAGCCLIRLSPSTS